MESSPWDEVRGRANLLVDRIPSAWENRTTEGYFGRARGGRAENIEMSKLLLDIVRDLKRINAHLAAAAYPVLEGRGELLPSRLKQDE